MRSKRREEVRRMRKIGGEGTGEEEEEEEVVRTRRRLIRR